MHSTYSEQQRPIHNSTGRRPATGIAHRPDELEALPKQRLHAEFGLFEVIRIYIHGHDLA